MIKLVSDKSATAQKYLSFDLNQVTLDLTLSMSSDTKYSEVNLTNYTRTCQTAQSFASLNFKTFYL